MAGGESGWATPDPVDPNLIWSSASGSGSVGGIVAIYEENRRQARNVEVWPEQANGIPADLRYRFNWTMPLTMSPHDRNTVYVGSQHVHRTSNRGQSWEVISPDLSTNDKARQQFSGGLTGDNIGVEYAFTVMAIAESRLERGVDLGRHQRRTGAARRATTASRGPTSRRTFRTCRRGARSATSNRRATTPARRTSPSICTRSTTATRSSTRPPTTARPGAPSPTAFRAAC